MIDNHGDGGQIALQPSYLIHRVRIKWKHGLLELIDGSRAIEITMTLDISCKECEMFY